MCEGVCICVCAAVSGLQAQDVCFEAHLLRCKQHRVKGACLTCRLCGMCSHTGEEISLQ